MVEWEVSFSALGIGRAERGGVVRQCGRRQQSLLICLVSRLELYAGAARRTGSSKRLLLWRARPWFGHIAGPGRRCCTILPTERRFFDCPEELFEQLQEEYRRLYYAWDFVNAATGHILSLLPEALAALDIPHGDILTRLIFQWPEQNKVSLTALSEQYHSKKFRFPYDCFIPRPSSFESSLPYLLTNDAALFSAPPVDLAVSAQAASRRMAQPVEHRRPPPPEWDMPRVRYLDEPFAPEDVETNGPGGSAMWTLTTCRPLSPRSCAATPPRTAW